MYALYSLYCGGVMIYINIYILRIHGYVDEYPLSTLSRTEVTCYIHMYQYIYITCTCMYI